jgi:hypothetical protein
MAYKIKFTFYLACNPMKKIGLTFVENKQGSLKLNKTVEIQYLVIYQTHPKIKFYVGSVS